MIGEMVTMLTLIKGVEISYTAVRVSVRYWHIYQEVASKIDVAKGVIDLGQDIVQTTKKSRCKKMFSLVKTLAKTYVHAEVAMIEREERRTLYRAKVLADYRHEQAMKKDAKDETDLFEMGFLRDRLCKRYIEPVRLLGIIADAIQTKSKLSTEDKCKLVELIVNPKMKDAAAFAPFESAFYYIEVICPVTDRPFECAKLVNPVYSVETIVWLKQKMDAFYKLPLEQLKHDHEFC